MNNNSFKKLAKQALEYLKSDPEKEELEKLRKRAEEVERNRETRRKERETTSAGTNSTEGNIGTGTIEKNRAFHTTWGELGKKRKKDYPDCPYCGLDDVIRRGKRKKKRGAVQLYKCKACGKSFTPREAKGKHYPLYTILDGLSYYHLGYTLQDSARLLEKKYGFEVSAATLSNWVSEFKDTCTYGRIRKFGKKLYDPREVLAGINLYHRQVYKFRIHRAKLSLLLQEDIRHRKFGPLREFLETIFQECPHYFFKEGQRASECKVSFDLGQTLIHKKQNYANRLAKLVLPAVKENKLRHEAVQQFFICNDSATVATEVPVYLLPEDVEHMQTQLKFKIPLKIGRVLTGHIDLVQLRNNAVHIMDYKPGAAKEKPITQLTLYALAMSRLTGLRLYDMKCSWFDEHDYYEFFPLHVVYKLREKQRSVPPNQKRLIEAEKL